MKNIVLLIDDDESIREVTRDVLEGAGFLVFTAVNGENGLAVLAAMPPPCAVLVDVNMPVMGGPEFLAAVRANSELAAIPVIAISATGTRSGMVGAQEFVSKPFDIETLLRTIRKYCSAEPQKKERAR